ncbi:synaptonemal complex protein 2-like [Leptodactylus fuscus]
MKGGKQLNKDKAGDTCMDDVYSFHSKGSDEPTIELGVSSIVISKQMVNIAVTSGRPLSMKNTKSKKEHEQKHKNFHKHLFSDTDTDRGGDDSKTDISWLQNPGSKKKAYLGYSRQRQGNPPKEKTVSSETAKHSRKAKDKDHKKLCDLKLGKKDTEQTSKQSKCKRPQRGLGKRKKSMKSSNSEAESEEEPQPPSRKQILKQHFNHEFLTTEKEQNLKHPSCTKMYKHPPKIEEDTVKTNKIPAPVCKIAASPADSSPASVEQMRSEQYESDTELRTRHPTMTYSSPSLSASPPEQNISEESMNISVDSKKVNKEWTELNEKSASKWAQTTHRTGKNLDIDKTVQRPLSPACSHCSQSTLNLDHSAVSGVNVLEVTGHEYNEPQVKFCSPVTNARKIEAHTLKKKAKYSLDQGLGFSCLKEQASTLSIPFQKTLAFQPQVKTFLQVLQTPIFEHLCPTLNDTISYIKRINKERIQHAGISTEGSDCEITLKKIKLCPRKLFPSPDVQEVPPEHLSSVSGNNASTAGTDTLDGSSSDVGMMCKQISKEFARKIQNRSRKMDYFTKQSLKSAQKHLNSVDVQVRECRIMHLEKFHETVLDEIESFEKDSQALKQMEKEFASFWSQQTQVLNLYHKNEHRRINSLKASFEVNVSHTTEYDEKIFNSEMHSMKENMKAVQERLLKEMQEEELLSVRRGLQSLFMSGTGPF